MNPSTPNMFQDNDSNSCLDFEPLPRFRMDAMSDNLPFPPPPPLTGDHQFPPPLPLTSHSDHGSYRAPALKRPVLQRGQSVPQMSSSHRAGRMNRSKAVTKPHISKHVPSGLRPNLVTPKSPKKLRKLTVSFSNFANVQTLEKSEDELNSTWLNREEYYQISESRRRCMENIKAAIKGRAPTPEDDLIDGLEESLSLSRVVERKKKNWAYRKLLIQEQEVQKQFGVCDPQALASLSVAFSIHSAKRAARRASMNNTAMDF